MSIRSYVFPGSNLSDDILYDGDEHGDEEEYTSQDENPISKKYRLVADLLQIVKSISNDKLKELDKLSKTVEMDVSYIASLHVTAQMFAVYAPGDIDADMDDEEISLPESQDSSDYSTGGSDSEAEYSPPHKRPRTSASDVSNLKRKSGAMSMMQTGLPSISLSKPPSVYVSVPHPGPVPSDDIYIRAADHIVSFLERVAPLLDGVHNCKLTEYISQHTDNYSPFREQAASRSIVKAAVTALPEGDQYFLTAAAFANELIFRGITFGTDFILRDPSSKFLFTSDEDFKNTTHGMEESHICKPNIYGAYISQRKSLHSTKFWETSKYWPVLLAKHDNKVPFNVMIRFLLGKDHVYSPDLPEPSGTSSFPAMGLLICTMVALDLGYHGVVDLPSQDEMAYHILSLNRGATSALDIMKVFPFRVHGKIVGGNQSTNKDVILSLENREVAKEIILNVYHFVRLKLKAKKMIHLMPDVVHFEHTLCKMSKAHLHYSTTGYKIV